ncbi:PDZ domain (Also known as DHR or GLGF)/PDZ domain containing protein [Novymonas esmeraldas]|uniref:PDZ domain (Also known as DHR or GLGF)/PDZ domain containing protein n=1 Tax=Novymonas esmeraldas TaxID=1808958 RepID=A0AAW0ERT4_9TRYP
MGDIVACEAAAAAATRSSTLAVSVWTETQPLRRVGLVALLVWGLWSTVQYISATYPAGGDASAPPRPFIGFSLADNIVDGALIVDGVVAGSPADQSGIDIDHELVAINGSPANTIAAVRELIATHCRPGEATRMTLRRYGGGGSSNEDGGDEACEVYEVLLSVMTADTACRGMSSFFDTTVHHVRQSSRPKTTWSTRAPEQ